MDFRQLQYVLMIANEGNITKAADKLYITRSALNYSLLNTEKELGFPLFKRLSNRLIPTYAGEIFIENARRILADCKEMEHSMLTLSDASHQRLAIGITVGGGQKVLTALLPEYHKKYPHITFNLMEGNLRVLEDALVNGQIDIAFFGGLTDNSLLEYREVIDAPRLMLAVPKDFHLIKEYGLDPSVPADLNLFRSELFISMNRKSFLRDIIDDIFRTAKIKPPIIMECSQISMVASLIEGHVGIGFLPEERLKKHPALTGFPVEPAHYTHQTILYRKGSRFSVPELELMAAVENYYAVRNP